MVICFHSNVQSIIHPVVGASWWHGLSSVLRGDMVYHRRFVVTWFIIGASWWHGLSSMLRGDMVYQICFYRSLQFWLCNYY